MEIKVLPHDEATERIVINTLTLEPHNWYEINQLLHEDCFYHPLHRRIFNIIRQCHEKGNTFDMVSILEELQRTGEGMDADTFLKAFRYHSSDIYINACVLVELDQRRKIAELAQQLYRDADNQEIEVPELISATASRLTQLSGGPSTAYHTLDEAIGGVRQQIERNCNHESPITGPLPGLPLWINKAAGCNAQT